MNNEEKEKKIKEVLEYQDLYIVKSVDNINHRPHPFCIGSEHIKPYVLDTSSGCAMRVNENRAWSTGYKKGYHRCGLQPEDHKSDNVCFLQLKRNGTNDEANIILKKLVADLGETFVDGFAFVETDEKFRVEK